MLDPSDKDKTIISNEGIVPKGKAKDTVITGDGILRRCWIVFILPYGTFHTVGYV